MDIEITLSITFAGIGFLLYIIPAHFSLLKILQVFPQSCQGSIPGSRSQVRNADAL